MQWASCKKGVPHGWRRAHWREVARVWSRFPTNHGLGGNSRWSWSSVLPEASHTSTLCRGDGKVFARSQWRLAQIKKSADYLASDEIVARLTFNVLTVPHCHLCGSPNFLDGMQKVAAISLVRLIDRECDSRQELPCDEFVRHAIDNGKGWSRDSLLGLQSTTKRCEQSQGDLVHHEESQCDQIPNHERRETQRMCCLPKRLPRHRQIRYRSHFSTKASECWVPASWQSPHYMTWSRLYTRQRRWAQGTPQTNSRRDVWRPQALAKQAHFHHLNRMLSYQSRRRTYVGRIYFICPISKCTVLFLHNFGHWEGLFLEVTITWAWLRSKRKVSWTR